MQVINCEPFLVSVVITCYNQARFLGEAIESVLQQTYPQVDLVILDDGSTDNTSEVIARYPTVRHIRQENQGVVAARNRGFSESRGDYIVFLDGDDRLAPTALEIGLDALRTHPECAFVSGRCRVITSDGALDSISPQTFIEDDPYAALLYRNFIWTPAKAMFRRSALEVVKGFNPSMDHSCDYDLYLRLARRFPVYCHNEVVVDWRVHDTNTSHKSVIMLSGVLATFRAQRDYVKKNKQYRKAYKAGLKFCRDFYEKRLIEQARVQLRERGEWKQSLHSMLGLMRYSPLVFAKQAKSFVARRLGAALPSQTTKSE